MPSKVELVAEFLHHPPVQSELGPVLHRDDVAAGKTGALLTRAEVRDAIEVAHASASGQRPRAICGSMLVRACPPHRPLLAFLDRIRGRQGAACYAFIGSPGPTLAHHRPTRRCLTRQAASA